MATLRLSPHFTLDELLTSEAAARHGIDMTPSLEVIANLTRLCVTVLEPLRASCGGPVIVTSGYRPPALNRLIGGAPGSAHLSGRAADIVTPSMSVRALAVRAGGIHQTDKTICEFDRWVHVQVAQNGNAPRRELYTAYREAGRTVYARGLVPVV